MKAEEIDALVAGLMPAIDEAIKARVAEYMPREPVDGKDGINGKDGQDGKDGKDGAKGETGERGERGEAGINGADGKDGKDGRDGRDGRDGSDGRDAAAIEPLMSIDFDRSYARGTFAFHNGGMWYATHTTHGREGWYCAINGETSSAIEWHDERTYHIVRQYADGSIRREAHVIPVIIYRNVYDATRETPYEPGDVVTWAGSAWHCNTITREQPGINGDWRLIVKRGRDGKDGGRQ
ncbi:hypothetical protein QF001_003763 [Paraburkholderia youngii]|uniref:hypothetical protein n=1 Tax=Paraburkholderia youngii TaxID=2782701 RepID=UPI003D207105